jgi:hypothetical protein
MNGHIEIDPAQLHNKIFEYQTTMKTVILNHITFKEVPVQGSCDTRPH